MKKKIGELLFQIIPVMIGVFLGFVASHWADDRKLKSQTELLRKNLVAEIKANKERVNNVIEYHEILRDSSRYYSNTEELSKRPKFFSGVRTTILTNNTFETGIQTGLINGLTFEEMQSLNNVYTLQNSYSEFANMILSGLMTLDFTDKKNGMRRALSFLSVSMTDVVIKEKQLLEEYEDLLNKLKHD